MHDKTTDLAIIRTYPSRFTWGYPDQFYDVGRYTIVQYKVNKMKTTIFHLWVDNKDTSRGYGTLDEALIGAVAHGNLEVNEAGWMAMAGAKLLGLK